MLLLYRDVFESWFNDKELKKSPLFDFLCINKSKKCCPEGYYGPKCKQCPLYEGKNGIRDDCLFAKMLK